MLDAQFGLEELFSSLALAGESVIVESGLKTARLAEVIKELAKDKAPFGRSSGDPNSDHSPGYLQDSIEIHPGIEVLGPYWEVEVMAPYGVWVEYGHGEITPKTAKALHFWVDGQEVFTQRVRAQPPRPFFRPAIAEGVMDWAAGF